MCSIVAQTVVFSLFLTLTSPPPHTHTHSYIMHRAALYKSDEPGPSLNAVGVSVNGSANCNKQEWLFSALAAGLSNGQTLLIRPRVHPSSLLLRHGREGSERDRKQDER